MHSLAFCIVVGAISDNQNHRDVVGTMSPGARLAIGLLVSAVSRCLLITTILLLFFMFTNRLSSAMLGILVPAFVLPLAKVYSLVRVDDI